MGALLTKDQILNAPDLPTERLTVPGWAGDVLVRGLMADERDDYERETYVVSGTTVTTNLKSVRARLCARCIVDEQGQRIFSDDEIPALGRKSSAALEPIVEAIRRLSGMLAGDVEKYAGNSEPGPNGATPSGSPSGSAG